jgi:hypothetical protein
MIKEAIYSILDVFLTGFLFGAITVIFILCLILYNRK